MDRKDAALFQCPKDFQKDLLTIAARDVVVDVVAGHCVKGLIREVQMYGVSLPETYIAHALCLRILFTQ